MGLDGIFALTMPFRLEAYPSPHVVKYKPNGSRLPLLDEALDVLSAPEGMGSYMRGISEERASVGDLTTRGLSP